MRVNPGADPVLHAVLVRRRLLIALGLVTALLGTGFAAGSADRCGAWPPANPTLLTVSRSEGALRVGAAKVELRFPGPVTVGGYAPWRSTATSAASPLFARALVLDVGGQQVRLVLLDLLLVAPRLRDRIAEGQAHPTWVLATHTHSGPGGYDTRPAAQLAGLGALDPELETTLVTAARQALTDAEATLTPASLRVSPLDSPFSVARSGADVDSRLSAFRFEAGDRALAELLVVSAHPTLVERRTAQLDPDWPGAVASAREANGGPVTLVVQGAGGNASVDRARFPTVRAAADALLARVAPNEARAPANALPADAAALPADAGALLADAGALPADAGALLTDAGALLADAGAPPASTSARPADAQALGAPAGPTRLAWSSVRVGLPRPDASRLVPGVLRAFTENLLCDGAEDVAVLHGLRLGALELLFVPLEPSYAAGRVLEEQARVQRVVSLADGYAGYVETEEAARTSTGESRRQYFPPELLTRLAEGARLAGAALRD